jgi:hypothetical protein
MSSLTSPLDERLGSLVDELVAPLGLAGSRSRSGVASRG